MPANNGVISFKYGLATNYKAIPAKDANTMYFCTDTQQIYVGDTEYTRPIQHGAELPSTFLPPNSFFYKTDSKELYFSEDGAKWTACSNFYVHPSFTAKVVGDNTAGAVAFGGSVKVPKVTVDEQGHVSAAEDITITLPTETKNTVTVEGDGNAVTAAAFDEAGHALTLTKGETFATKQQLDDAIGKITSFEIDANEGEGYENLEALQTAHPEGVKGTIYLVKSASSKTGNTYSEYLWTGTSYEKFGEFGDVDLSDYVPTSRTINGKALTADITLAKADVGLDKADNTPDAEKKVAEAAKLSTARTIEISGDATGSATFDGSENINIAATVSHATAADTATNADEATHATAADTAKKADAATKAEESTKATQDGAGNIIADTYATKTELTDAALKWGTF